jgi:hypothetical protein
MRVEGDQKVLVCGGREFNDEDLVFRTLDELHSQRPIGLLIHGACKGADLIAERWARQREVMYLGVPAPWSRLKRAAGPKRNQYMLEKGKPDLVVGFPGNTGTADMLRQTRAAGKRVLDLTKCMEDEA